MSEDRQGRWFRCGDPWGLLARANPEATAWSVLRRAILYGLTYPWLYAALIYYRHDPTPHWPFKLSVCMVLFMVLGGLLEWHTVSEGNLSDGNHSEGRLLDKLLAEDEAHHVTEHDLRGTHP